MLNDDSPQSTLEELLEQVEEFDDCRLKSKILHRLTELDVMLEKLIEAQNRSYIYGID